MVYMWTGLAGQPLTVCYDASLHDQQHMDTPSYAADM